VKDATQPQDNLKKEGWASVEVTMPIPHFSLDQGAAGREHETDYKPS